MSSSCQISAKNWDKLPIQLIIEILSRLQAKTLGQYKVVCRLWHNIIQSQYFISKHLENYYNNDTLFDSLFIRSVWCDIGLRCSRCYIRWYILSLDDKTSKYSVEFVDFDSPFNLNRLCGPCNGIYYQLMLLSAGNGSCSYLWNPTLKERVQLPNIIRKPDLPSYLTACESLAHGLFFDSKVNDYKVIVINGYKNTSVRISRFLRYPLSVFIYSLRSNSWRYWGDLKKTYYLSQNMSYVLANGCYHWLGSSTKRFKRKIEKFEVIVPFDVILEEACREIPLPEFAKANNYISQLIGFHDKIAFVHTSARKFSVWVWNEVECDWTRKLNMNLGVDVSETLCSHWKDNFVVLFKRHKLFVCDIYTKQVRIYKNPNKDTTRWFSNRSDILYAHKESLVSIKELMSNAGIRPLD